MHKLQDVLNLTGIICRLSHPHTIVGALFIIFIVFITPVFAYSQDVLAAQTVPYKMNFQGRLTDSNGNVPANGKYNMRLRLMSALSGGSNLWQADRIYNSSAPTDYRIQVTNGLFSIQLGDVASGVASDPTLSPSIFNTQTNPTVYLEVELPTPLTADCDSNGCQDWGEGAMTPRQLISAAPYALNADAIDGIDGASLAQLSASNTFTGANLFKNTSDSTTAFQIQKSDNTPLFVADTTNLAIKIGGGDVSPDASPALLVLDHKNTSGDPTGTNGAMYYNSNTSKFRCYENGDWRDCIATPYNLRTTYLYQNDFVFGSYVNNTTVDGSYTMYSYMTTMTIASLAAEANHPGIARLSTTTGTTAIGGFITYNATTPIRFGGGNAWTYLSSVRMSALSATAAAYVFRGGFINNINSGSAETGITNGCYFRYTHTLNDDEYEGVCRSGNVQSSPTCDMNVKPTVNGGWDVLSITANSAGTAVTFTVNGGTPCTLTVGLPTAASTGFGTSVHKTSGTTARTIDVDYFEVRGTMQR